MDNKPLIGFKGEVLKRHKGCKCADGHWLAEPWPICEKFEPEFPGFEDSNCKNCEHEKECHK